MDEEQGACYIHCRPKGCAVVGLRFRSLFLGFMRSHFEEHPPKDDGDKCDRLRYALR